MYRRMVFLLLCSFLLPLTRARFVKARISLRLLISTKTMVGTLAYGREGRGHPSDIGGYPSFWDNKLNDKQLRTRGRSPKCGSHVACTVAAPQMDGRIRNSYINSERVLYAPPS
jgi:hypothetical protein